MSGAPDPLQRHTDRARRSDLADQIHGADIDTQLERRRRYHGLQLARFQPLLGGEAQLARQAAVMRQDRVRAQSLRQMMRDALR